MPGMSSERLLTLEKYRNTKISFDIDGVLAFSAVPVLKKFNSLFGTDKKPAELEDWNIVCRWAKEQGLTNEQALKIQQLWYDPEILFQSPPIPGAIALMRRLYEAGIKPLIISSRTSSCAQSTKDWFKLYMPFVDPDTINVPQTDVREERKLFKVGTIARHGITLHFEDSLEDIETILNMSPEINIVVIPHRYNYRLKSLPRTFEYDEKDVDLLQGPTLWPVYTRFLTGTLPVKP